MPALAEYLAKNYLTASTPGASKGSSDYADDGDNSQRPKKKRKKDKHARDVASNLLIADDDPDLLLSSTTAKAPQNDDDTGGPTIYESRVRSAEFRKKKQSAWTNVQGDVNQSATTAPQGGDDEATSILAAAAADQEQRRLDLDMEDAPAIVSETVRPDDNDGGPRMSSGAKAGLQTAADTVALLAAEAEREKRSAKPSRSRLKTEPQPEEETIYRDATGRRIDISMRRAEVRAAALAKQAAEKKEREDAMGDVQREQREQKKLDLEEAKFLTIGRTADDEEMNQGLKEVVRWDDPMAAYMAQKKAEEVASRPRDPKGRSRDEGNVAIQKPRRKEYQGAAPPNRYGIKPGWRWDGVDRGNGFEKEWFQARGRKSRNENMEYQWAYDE